MLHMKMKPICPLFIVFLLSIMLSAADSNPVIVKNELVLESGPGRYAQVRHIVLKGSYEQIGKALGEIARKDYKANLVKYASPIYAKARLEYMKKNNPPMAQYMKGIAGAYGLSLENTDFDTSYLYYCMDSPKCSAVFFPAEISADGKNFYVSNRDYYTAGMSEIMGGEKKPGEIDFLSRLFVIETYPDNGYASIGIGGLDLLNTRIDSVNSKGLAVAVLEDDTLGMEHTNKDLSRQTGLTQYQTVRLIIDTCATMDEAKQVILNNKISTSMMPAHFIVADSSGASFIYECSPDDFSDRIIDSAKGKPAVITNNSVYQYPTVDKLPEPSKDDYDTFNRFRRLVNFVDSHKGKYTAEDGQKAMGLVFGRVDEASEGGPHLLPLRTLYTTVVNIDEGKISVRFYQKDGKLDEKTRLHELIFTEPLEFQLKKQ
ncbi:MAG TPA: hypothetical protein DCZ94_02905 [Lentisphaeria bacterium]|nr:MAG: hypothetical protein A2X48_03530 [Lentisphaerae bacterium GWF2_49_21]HBC85883.1 hypothetical protein [Lentisphaeria bacterium]